MKQAQIDILLVVNMFLTGFDSKPLNTLYVDKTYSIITYYKLIVVQTVWKRRQSHMVMLFVTVI